MKLPAFLPAELRQLARFVPNRGWDAVEWQPMLHSLRKLSWRFVSGAGVARQAKLSGAQLDRVRLDGDKAAKKHDQVAFAQLTNVSQQRAAGDRVLHLYFRQWLVPEGLFLDLRPGQFAWGERTLWFRPNGLWLTLGSDFRTGMVDLYRAFYADDEPALRSALLRMGMLRPGLSAAAESELLSLLRSHFAIESGAQRFSIDEFKRSFDQLFDFFLAHGYRLHSDFVFVGFYLITLYLTLEAGGQKHDVRRLCLGALNAPLRPVNDPLS